MSEFFMYDGDPDKKKYYSLATEMFYAYYADYFSGENPRIERLSMPYESVSLPVMHVIPIGKSKGTLLVHGGNDSYYEEFLFSLLYLQELGYEVYLFESPGQGSVIRTQGMHFTHEWEKPTKAVLDQLNLNNVTIIGANQDHFINYKLIGQEINMFPNAKSLSFRLFTDKEEAQNHCNVGNGKLVLDTIDSWLDSLKKRDKKKSFFKERLIFLSFEHMAINAKCPKSFHRLFNSAQSNFFCPFIIKTSINRRSHLCKNPHKTQIIVI